MAILQLLFTRSMTVETLLFFPAVSNSTLYSLQSVLH